MTDTKQTATFNALGEEGSVTDLAIRATQEALLVLQEAEDRGEDGRLPEAADHLRDAIRHLYAYLTTRS